MEGGETLTLRDEIKSFRDYNCRTGLLISTMYDLIQLGNIEIFNWITEQYNFCFDNLVLIDYDIDEDQASLKSETQFIKRCLISDQVIIIPVRIAFSDGFTHYTGLIFNPVTKEIEYYEPHGYVALWRSAIDSVLKEYIKTNYPDYRYISSIDYCPIGPQRISRDGYCYAWTTLYFYLRAKYPQVNRRNLIVTLTSFGEESLRKIITNFICYLVEETHLIDLSNTLYQVKEATDKVSNLFGNLNITEENAEEVIELSEEYKQLFEEIDQLRYLGKQKELVSSLDSYIQRLHLIFTKGELLNQP